MFSYPEVEILKVQDGWLKNETDVFEEKNVCWTVITYKVNVDYYVLGIIFFPLQMNFCDRSIW